MIDFLKIVSFDLELINNLYNNALLIDYSLHQKRKKKYNEFNNATYIKEYKKIYFCFYIKDDCFTKLEILFKPHYYFNNNLHNANDFNTIDCIKTLNEVKNTFNLPVNELKILNIEFGINCVSPIDIKNLINWLYFHEKNLFYNLRGLQFAKISYKSKENGTANTYKQIKFYAKGLQFPQYTDYNTFRHEVKSKRSAYIKSLGIKTYADLLKFETYNTFAENLLKEFEKILIIDADNTMQNLNDKEKVKLNTYLNPITWNKYLQGSRNDFSKHKKKYFELLDKTENNIHSKLKVIIQDKLNELKKGAILTPQQKTKKGAILHSNIMETCTHNKKCIITGLDISMQKENSILISHTGLKHYYNTNKKEFEILKNKYLSKKWINASFKTQIKELAHNIRNKHNTLKRRRFLMYKPNQTYLHF